MNALPMLPGSQNATLAQIMEDIRRAQEDAMAGQDLAQAQYVPNSGIGGALLMGLQGFVGNKKRTEAEKKLSERAREYFDAQNRMQMEEMDRAAKAEELKRQQALQDYEAKKQVDARYATQKPPSEIAAFEAYQRMTPEQQQAFNAYQERRRAPAASVTVNAGGPAPTEFEKTLDKKDAESYQGWRQNAIDAQGTIDQLGILRQISENQRTGKLQEAQALIGQYFGTDAAANMQTYNAASNRMVLDLASKMKGALSDSDRKMLEDSVPRFGQDPRANQIVMALIEKGAQRQISLFDEADKYYNERRSLRGFRPSVAAPLQIGGSGGGGSTGSAGAPKAGEVMDGYRFKGGDPADPKNWERA